jgi:hypothetical protein
MHDSPLRKLCISKSSCLDHLYRRRILAVSHCWQDADEPDREGQQTREILVHLLEHPDP